MAKDNTARSRLMANVMSDNVIFAPVAVIIGISMASAERNKDRVSYHGHSIYQLSWPQYFPCNDCHGYGNYEGYNKVEGPRSRPIKIRYSEHTQNSP